MITIDPDTLYLIHGLAGLIHGGILSLMVFHTIR
jgi:hypothetical protein